MATVNTYTVGTGATRDYSTLTAWESARQGDLVTNDFEEHAACYADGEVDDYCVIDDWTTDATHFIRIYTPGSERHSGTEGTGFVLDAGTGLGYGSAIDISDNEYVRIEGLEMNATDTDCVGIYVAVGSNLRISHNLIYDCTNEGIKLNSYPASGIAARIWNNIIYNNGSNGLMAGDPDSIAECFIYNNTFFNNTGDGIGNNYGTTITAKNNASFDNGGDDFAGCDGSSDYNCSSDTTAPGGHSLTEKTASDNFVNVNPGSEDLHVLDTDADIYGAGYDLSSDPDLQFSDDVDGDTRS